MPEIEKRIGKLPEIEQLINTTNDYLSKLSGYFQKWPNIPDELKTFEPLYGPGSPVKLTPKGEGLIEEIGFKDIFTKNKNFFIETLKIKLNDRIKDDDFFYYAEKYSIQLINKLEEDEADILEPVRANLFKKGLTSNKKHIFIALGLFLRDQIIKELNKEKEFKNL